MSRFPEDDSGQLILLTCVSIVLALVLMTAYEYSTLWTGENSINRENKDSFYYYENIRELYAGVYNCDNLDFTKPTNITVFEKQLKQYALLHGYSVNFIRNGSKATIIFFDRDIRIKEELNSGGTCS